MTFYSKIRWKWVNLKKQNPFFFHLSNCVVHKTGRKVYGDPKLQFTKKLRNFCLAHFFATVGKLHSLFFLIIKNLLFSINCVIYSLKWKRIKFFSKSKYRRHCSTNINYENINFKMSDNARYFFYFHVSEYVYKKTWLFNLISGSIDIENQLFLAVFQTCVCSPS